MSEPQRGPGIWGKVHWRGLTVQLFVTVVLPLAVLLIGLAVGAVYFHQRAMRDLVGARDERAAASLARALEEQLTHRATSMAGLAAALADGVAPPRVLASAGYLQADFDGGLAVSNRAGNLAVAQPSAAVWQAWLRAAGTDWFPSEGTAFSPPFAAGDGSMLVLVAATADGRWWALGAFRPAVLAGQTLEGAFPVGPTVRVSLLSREGTLLFVAPPHAGAFLSPTALAAVRPGVSYVAAEDGEHVVVAWPVGMLGWTLVLEEAWEKAATSWLHATQWVPLLLVPLLLLVLWALWFGTRQVVMPLRQLESRATAAAWGDYAALAEPVEGIEEIQRLQRALRHMGQKVQRAQASLRGYIGAITAGQEEERRRLARELHDDTLQSLIALQQRIQLARLRFDSPQVQQSVDELLQLTEASIAELRRMIRGLRPLFLEDLGLVPALEMLAREVQAQHPPLRVEFVVSGKVRRLQPDQELALYRIAQEGLNNMIHHAGADWGQVVLQFQAGQVVLEIHDNGRGFRVPESPAELASQGHFGLLGMQERAELIGARLTIRSAPQQGTQIVLVLPLEHAAAAHFPGQQEKNIVHNQHR